MGTKKLAQEWNLTIDQDLRDLLPRDPESVEMLKTQLLNDGCRDKLVAWKKGNVLVDGHTRFDICSDNDIPFDVLFMDFDSKADAMMWARDNQKCRRNMTKPELIEVGHKIENVIRAEAKERQKATLKQNVSTDVENLPQREDGKSRDKLGAMAGVSGKTYEKGVHVLEHAPEPIKEAWKKEVISTDAAYRATKLPEEKQQSVIEAIENGKNVKTEVSKVLRQQKSVAPVEVVESPEDRLARIASIADPCTSDESLRNSIFGSPEPYNADDLISEIVDNSIDFERLLKTLINTRIGMVGGDSVKQRVRDAITGIIERLETLKKEI